ncbi:MAG: PIN domain-containing protein [Candidatus Bathyarchaeota archaeon]|nr:PIN domain-containing protein [Candidatus Bathyarchaeota archaeon]
MVETEFLFSFQPKDKHYDVVSNILEAYATTKPFPLHYPISALIEVREVMANHKKDAAKRLNTLTFIKAKATSFNLKEIELSSNDLILCEHLLIQHNSLTFFDGLHASVALNNKLSIVSNDEIYDELSLKRLSFKDFLKLLRT